MVKRSVCFILTFVMIVCSLLTDNSVYAASKLTTLKVDKVYKQFDLDHDGKNDRAAAEAPQQEGRLYAGRADRGSGYSGNSGSAADSGADWLY